MDPLKIPPRIWTVHGLGHDLCHGTLDLTKSAYASTVEGYIDRVQWLSKTLEWPGIIWFYSDLESMTLTDPRDESHLVWTIDPLRLNIFRFVEYFGWNRLLGKNREWAPPRYLQRKWKDAAYRQYPEDRDAAERLRDELQSEYFDRQVPEGGWEAALFPDRGHIEDVQIIAPFPLPAAAVLSTHTVAQFHSIPRHKR